MPRPRFATMRSQKQMTARQLQQRQKEQKRRAALQEAKEAWRQQEGERLEAERRAKMKAREAQAGFTVDLRDRKQGHTAHRRL